MPAPPPLRPLLPLAKRLNRNALIVSAVIMGMTVLTAVVVVHPTREAQQHPSPQPGVDDAPSTPSRPTFLDEPVRVAAAPSDTAVVGLVPLSGGREPTVRPSPADTASPAPGPPPGSGGPSARERAYQAALTSPLVLVSPARAPAAVSAQTDSTPLAAEEQRLLNLGDSVLRTSGRVPTGGAVQTTPQCDERHQRAFLEAAGDTRGATLSPALEPAGSPYTLRAGTVIPGLLLTGINSDLPGDLVAQVSRDVYDSRTQGLLLIPKGARLVGTYDNQVVVGEDRLLVAWTRLIFPDGRSLRLPGLALKDVQGQSGAKDQVDTHWRRAFGRALLLSAISAGVQLSQPQQTSPFAAPSAGQVAAGALGQELSNVALEILRRGMDVPPTITIRQAQPFNVFLNGDLVFDRPYEEERPDTLLTSRRYP